MARVANAHTPRKLKCKNDSNEEDNQNCWQPQPPLDSTLVHRVGAKKAPTQ